MKRIFAVMLSLSLMLAGLSGCGTPGQPAETSPQPSQGSAQPAPDSTVYTLTVSSPKNDKAEAPFIEWLHELEELSGGRLQFDIYTSNALYQQSEVISAMAAGMCDICDLSLSEEPSTFALNSNIISLPFMGMGYENDWIYQTLYEEYEALRQEYENAGVILIDYSYNPPFNLHFSTDTPVKTPADLKGVKVVTTSDILSSFIAEQGGAPVNQPITEWYNSLEKGVATGLVAHANNIYNFGIIELLKQDLIFGEGSGITTNLNAYLWAENSWNNLPADLQQLVLDNVDKLHESNNASQQAQVLQSDEACQENGNVITVLSDDEIAVWRDAADSVISGKLSQIEADTGAPVREMYERALELAAQ